MSAEAREEWDASINAVEWVSDQEGCLEAVTVKLRLKD
jgi:hypothetical protein